MNKHRTKHATVVFLKEPCWVLSVHLVRMCFAALTFSVKTHQGKSKYRFKLYFKCWRNWYFWSIRHNIANTVLKQKLHENRVKTELRLTQSVFQWRKGRVVVWSISILKKTVLHLWGFLSTVRYGGLLVHQGLHNSSYFFKWFWSKSWIWSLNPRAALMHDFTDIIAAEAEIIGM